MAHNPVTPLQQAGGDTTIALTEYKMLAIQELSKKELPQMTKLGSQDTSNMLRTRYPISVSDPIFAPLIAENPEFARIGEVFFELFTMPFQAGALESAARLRSAEWARLGWQDQPALFAVALQSLFERLLAGSATATRLIPAPGGFKGGKVTPSCENIGTGTSIKVFQKRHPCNPLNPDGKTYDNLYTGAATGSGEGLDADGNYPGALPLSADSIRIVRNLFGQQFSPNGEDPRNYPLTHIACGKDLEDKLVTLCKDDMLLVASSTTTPAAADSPLVYRKNPLKNFSPITPIINPHLNEPGVWYPISANELGRCPWMTVVKVPNSSGQVPGMPGPGIVMADGVEWKLWNELSTLYLEGSKIGPPGHVAMAALVEAAAGINWCWRIKRCEPT